jgi:hypothetical protein
MQLNVWVVIVAGLTLSFSAPAAAEEQLAAAASANAVVAADPNPAVEPPPVALDKNGAPEADAEPPVASVRVAGSSYGGGCRGARGGGHGYVGAR